MEPEDFVVPSELETIQDGPMKPLVDAVKCGHPVLVALRSNRKLYGELKAIDRHWNMIVENAYEIWSPDPTSSRKTVTPQKRFIKCLFLRGDNVICVCPNPRLPE